MRFSNVLFGHVLLHLAQALYLPQNIYSSLTARANSKESSLEWSQCGLDFGNKAQNETQKDFDCARLEVPLDYTNSSNTKTITLDLIRFKATKTPHRGSVLFNPGGPGGSGVESMLVSGPILSSYIGNQYDIIGFDTRGTGRTIPFTCPEPPAGEDATGLKRRDFNNLPRLNTWELVKTKWWEESADFAESCWEANRDMGQFYGTTAVARDMMSIVDALSQGDKLNYWGISYGTVLGQVVASMFPKRVGRIVLDSNLNADDYAANAWLDSLIDTERSLANVFDDCVKSRKDACSLADFHGKNTTGESLLETFKEKLEVASADAASEEEGDEAYAMKQNILAGLYAPSSFPELSTQIEAFLKRHKSNDTPKSSDTTKRSNTPKPSDTPTPLIPTSKWSPQTEYALPAIACGDSSYRANEPDDLFPIYKALYEQSSFSDLIISDAVTCSQWKFSAVEPIDFNKLRNVDTSNPILVVNGRYDPVTSLQSALKVAAKFPGSRLVVHEGAGHSSLAHPSSCTIHAIRNYFVDGKMPEVNTTCSTDMTAFEWANNAQTKTKAEAKKKKEE
ncbi:Alpha/Beta hydrolase protein [Fusarium venenatum]|uniref:Alpha/Beta hydrolase protein n=1 Tax=Fusarium venenatum TaxID=56646 RepID=UPI001E0925F6|nr:Alpha/Beta hydrolase protein [Fusarium venenatum]